MVQDNEGTNTLLKDPNAVAEAAFDEVATAVVDGVEAGWAGHAEGHSVTPWARQLGDHDGYRRSLHPDRKEGALQFDVIFGRG